MSQFRQMDLTQLNADMVLGRPVHEPCEQVELFVSMESVQKIVAEMGNRYAALRAEDVAHMDQIDGLNREIKRLDARLTDAISALDKANSQLVEVKRALYESERRESERPRRDTRRYQNRK